jgi:hypothetical protein
LDGKFKNSAKRRAPVLEKQKSGWGPRYSPTQGFNLLQNQYKLVLRKLDPQPSSKVGVIIWPMDNRISSPELELDLKPTSY